MASDLLSPPVIDPTPVLDVLDQQYGSYVLAAAVEHFKVFDILAEKAMSGEELRTELGLAPRAATVLLTALRAMGLIAADKDGLLTLPAISLEYLCVGGAPGSTQYI
jgi:DNA-binding transcriptional ArsR family regulator